MVTQLPLHIADLSGKHEDNSMGEGMDERKERRWKSLRKRENLSLNRTEWKD